MKKPNPIVVRPRKGSALEEVWEGEGRKMGPVAEIIHGWADQFKQMAKASEKGNDDDQ